MHLLIIAIGSAGDVYPFLAIGRAALMRGHAVTVCTSPFFQHDVQALGLRFLPLGTAAAFATTMADPRLWNPRTSLRTLWGAVADTLEAMFTITAGESTGRTVVLGSLWAFGARVVQECTGVPYLCAHVSPSTLLSAHAPPEHATFTPPPWWPLALRRAALNLAERLVIDRLMAPALNALRRKVGGLAPTRRVMTRWMHSPDGVLALFPPWFAPPQPDWPQALHCIGFPHLDAVPGTGLDDALLSFLAAGGPPVVVTAGSTSVAESTFLARVLAAVLGLGHRVVVLASAPALPPQPSGSMLQRAFVNFGALLPRCAAIVHHGGIGTAAAALRAGMPQLVMPFAHDQFDNAARVVRLGVGLRLPSRASTPAIRIALASLLRTESIRARSAALAPLTVADSGDLACHRALVVVEALAAARRRPIEPAAALRQPASSGAEAMCPRSPSSPPAINPAGATWI